MVALAKNCLWIDFDQNWPENIVWFWRLIMFRLQASNKTILLFPNLWGLTNVRPAANYFTELQRQTEAVESLIWKAAQEPNFAFGTPFYINLKLSKNPGLEFQRTIMWRAGQQNIAKLGWKSHLGTSGWWPGYIIVTTSTQLAGVNKIFWESLCF